MKSLPQKTNLGNQEARPKPLTPPTSDAFFRELVDQAAERVAEIVLVRLDEREQPLRPAVVGRREMAALLSLSVDSFDKVRRLPGFPELRVCDSPRFEPEAVLGFLRSNAEAGK